MRCSGAALVQFLTLLWLLAQTMGSGLLGYNCSHSEATSQEYSLLDVAECPDYFSTRNKNEKKVSIQILQKAEYSVGHGYAVRITRQLNVYRCGGTPSTHAHSERILDLHRSEIFSIYEERIWGDEYLRRISHGVFEHLKSNTSHHKTRTVFG